MIATLDPIDLAELDQRARLLTRFDRKYLLRTDQLPGLLERLADQVRVLSIEGRREFGYRSDYLDAIGLDCYLDAARRRPRRFKVRFRTYLDSGDRFFEVKVRGQRGRTVKHRVPARNPGELGSAEVSFGQSVLAGAGIHRSLAGFRLALTTRYRRSTLFVPATGERITIDTGLRWCLPGGGSMELPGAVFVETKSPRPVPEIDRVLWGLGHRPVSVSKYATGMAALRPDLPSHHWRPLLRRYFN